jgi:hypothetical protein
MPKDADQLEPRRSASPAIRDEILGRLRAVLPAGGCGRRLSAEELRAGSSTAAETAQGGCKKSGFGPTWWDWRRRGGNGASPATRDLGKKRIEPRGARAPFTEFLAMLAHGCAIRRADPKRARDMAINSEATPHRMVP